MCDCLDKCLEMFEGSGWKKIDRPELVRMPPLKVNPFKIYYVSDDPYETVIYTPNTKFTFVRGKLRSIENL